ncbi:MAG TPA: Verru_Chthon cassette protein A, partial [Terrimicrobiaceae bacterium]|nr:Verru_Chthon cassette protein A [Terrimicrobiaceae bacterium]
QGSGVGSQHKARDVATTGGLVSTGGTASYPLIGIPVTVNAAGNMTLEGGPVTIEIYANSAKTELLGKAEFNIGTVSLPVPTLQSDRKYWAFHKNGIFGNADPANPVGRFGPIGGSNNSLASNTGELVDPADTVQTWILPHGDLRMLFGPKTGGLAQFNPSPSAGSLPNMKHFLLDLSPFVVGSGTSATLMQSVKMSTRLVPAMMPPASYPAGLNAPWTFDDWDSTTPYFIEDGPFINKPDEGSLYDANTTINPYSTQQGNTEVSGLGSQYHSANRQISSAVMFGSLPTGMIEGQPWQTLLFRPDPGGHPGAADPPDHLLLDLFWMPVVEPYAISEPFSTAGKANMNYQMIPFTWIERSTGLHAVLANEALLALPDSTILPGSNGGFTKLRGAAAVDFNPALPLDAQETLTPFRTKFANGGVFITPSEITTLPLVPQGQTYSGMSAFWNTNRPTGENLRERPYATIYPRLTTKSNVFNIHYRVQTLRQRPGDDPAVWDESKGRTTAELRGSTLVERYIDMNAAGLLGDFATDASANAESLYRFRILATKDFNP